MHEDMRADHPLRIARALDRDGYARPSEAGLLLGEQLRAQLGARYADFDERFAALTSAEPTCKTPAETVLREMGALAAPISDRALAEHSIAQLLRYVDPGEVVCRRAGGEPITASQMLQHLQVGDEAALQFCRNLAGAALRLLRLGEAGPS